MRDLADGQLKSAYHGGLEPGLLNANFVSCRCQIGNRKTSRRIRSRYALSPRAGVDDRNCRAAYSCLCGVCHLPDDPRRGGLLRPKRGLKQKPTYRNTYPFAIHVASPTGKRLGHQHMRKSKDSRYCCWFSQCKTRESPLAVSWASTGLVTRRKPILQSE